MTVEKKRNDIIDKILGIGIILKGINGVLEVIGGALFIFLNLTRLNKIIVFITQHELTEDPNDVVAKNLIKFGANYNISLQYFWMFYLLIHGVIKIITVILLRKRNLLAYPIAISTLTLFVVYQLYRYTVYHSFSLIILAIFDIIIIVLALVEYKKILCDL